MAADAAGNLIASTTKNVKVSELTGGHTLLHRLHDRLGGLEMGDAAFGGLVRVAGKLPLL